MRKWQPLHDVLEEFEAAKRAAAYVAAANDKGLSLGEIGTDASNFGRMHQRLEPTYIIRLVSAFEGVLWNQLGEMKGDW